MPPATPPWGTWIERAEGLLEAVRAHLAEIVASWALPALIATVVVLAACLVAGGLLTRRALLRRVTYLVVPTDDFAPSGEDLRSHAAELMRARRRTGGLLTRRANAVRIGLGSAPGGHLIYWRSGPDWAELILRIPGYAGVELIPLAEVDLDELLQRSRIGSTPHAEAAQGRHDPRHATRLDGSEEAFDAEN